LNCWKKNTLQYIKNSLIEITAKPSREGWGVTFVVVLVDFVVEFVAVGFVVYWRQGKNVDVQPHIEQYFLQ
jgi:hypothetical protein